eukprot:g9572.t1
MTLVLSMVGSGSLVRVSGRRRFDVAFQVLKDNGYPKNWVRRCLREQHQKKTTRPNTLITLPYIMNTSELTTRLLRPLGIRVAHKP